MSSQEDRISTFKDTINWINSDPQLSAAVAYSKAHTDVFHEDEYPPFTKTRFEKTRVEVTKERSFESAMRLSKAYPGQRIAVLNFANAFKPGGGVKSGSNAQEESLCRCSTLYPLLHRKSLRKSFYEYHKNLKRAEATDSVIYTSDVVICKTDTDQPERLSHNDWVKVDVITAAAPDLRNKSNVHAGLVGKGIRMTDPQLYACHLKRAIHILTAAAAKKVDILVLGAFGCGAFENNPNVVAHAYKEAFEQFPKVFKRIVFAIYSSTSPNINYFTFSREFRNIVKESYANEETELERQKEKPFVTPERIARIMSTKKIVLKSCSGFCTLDDAYTDKLVLEPNSLVYDYIPNIPSDHNPKEEYSYRSESKFFDRVYGETLAALPRLLVHERLSILDAGEIELKICFEDGKEEEYSWSVADPEVGYLIMKVRKLFPSPLQRKGMLDYAEDPPLVF